MGDFTRVKSPMNFHGGFYPSGNTLDYKMTHCLFTLFQIISNILTSSLLTFSVIYTFYFYIASEGLKIYQKYLIKKVPDFPFLEKFIWDNLNDYLRNSFLEGFSNFSLLLLLFEVLDQGQTVLDTPHLKMVTVSTSSRTHIPTGWFFLLFQP